MEYPEMFCSDPSAFIVQLLLSGRCVGLHYHFDSLQVCTFHWEVNLAIKGLTNLER